MTQEIMKLILNSTLISFITIETQRRKQMNKWKQIQVVRTCTVTLRFLKWVSNRCWINPLMVSINPWLSQMKARSSIRCLKIRFSRKAKNHLFRRKTYNKFYLIANHNYNRIRRGMLLKKYAIKSDMIHSYHKSHRQEIAVQIWGILN